MTSLSVLVVFRDDPPTIRSEVWELLRACFERDLPEVEVLEETDEGVPLNKSRALNKVAARASGEILLVTDADTWLDPDAIAEGLERIARRPRGWAKPWNRKVRLDEATTRRVLELGAGWDGRAPADATFENIRSFWAAPPLLIPAALWADVGGMDERAAGWGSEDAILATALKTLHGPAVVLPRTAVHLWHPRIGTSGADLWPGQDPEDRNQALYAAYRRAARRVSTMREFLAERDRELAPSA